MNHRYLLSIALVLLATFSVVCRAGDCCSQCQCHCKCSKVCRLVNEERKVEVVCWGVLAEEFCVPGPSCPQCQNCETVCDACQEKAAGAKAAVEQKQGDGDKKSAAKELPLTKPKKFVWTTWLPGCADIYTKKKLMKKTVIKKVPSYKWVVEDLCPECQAKAKSAPVAPDAKMPTPPKTDAKIIEPAK